MCVRVVSVGRLCVCECVCVRGNVYVPWCNIDEMLDCITTRRGEMLKKKNSPITVHDDMRPNFTYLIITTWILTFSFPLHE